MHGFIWKVLQFLKHGYGITFEYRELAPKYSLA